MMMDSLQHYSSVGFTQSIHFSVIMIFIARYLITMLINKEKRAFSFDWVILENTDIKQCGNLGCKTEDKKKTRSELNKGLMLYH